LVSAVKEVGGWFKICSHHELAHLIRGRSRAREYREEMEAGMGRGVRNPTEKTAFSLSQVCGKPNRLHVMKFASFLNMRKLISTQST